MNLFRTLLLGALLLQQGKLTKDQEETETFFKTGQIPRLVIELDDAACAELRKEPRVYVMGRLRENDKILFDEVAFKLKGAAGSFREFDEDPSFTVKMDKGDDDQKFHGLRKFHLNKSPQDDTYLHELLGSEIFRAAGVLSPRITHARLWVNKRDMGFYVIKEGFDRSLIKRAFEKSGGNLYDGGFCQDLDAELQKDEGRNPDDRADLHALREACLEPDLTKRWARIQQLVDVKAFITFMAIELMLGHWDGYCGNRNNYRIYVDPATTKAFFLPHGMDQLFGDADASILDMPAGMLASSIMKNPAWRADYRKRVGELLPLFSAEKLKRRVDEVARRLQPVLEAWKKDAARDHQGAVDGLKARLEAREKSLKEQRVQPDPKPLVFQTGQAVRVVKWRTASECEDAALTTVKENGVELLKIATGKSGRCIASFRRSVLLPQGRYKFRVMMAAKDVTALQGENNPPGVGGGLRISGVKRENQMLGSSEFKPVEFEFEVAEETADVELVIELRAGQGAVGVRTDSITLTKLGK